ncbi:methyltransferase domain-containing protein [Streptomyces bohaiensis]|uniref:Protein-L-isoaspartate O-methyltransferase n=1 Tax=Streptomyces bohaiensis TaxID=1431344 RepID=A0ABX1CCW5_9ACTN|nr:methyltransferase domain-containing protein [Streptomyces bohaiensis]NJQ15565.1 methyltransferase domain-containing protein [Streptomyces bohaiensis]
MDRTEETDRAALRLRTELVEGLDAAGVLPDPAWRAAFAAVPRHVFVPYFYDVSGLRISGERRREAWLRGVHSDQALVTRRQAGEPVSSSSQPSLMASMLHALEVEDGCRVLEIGTGTGYNAALLAHRLGDAAVTSVDVVPEITAIARARLAAAGYGPRVVTADGALGWPEGAPYDRIIATCRVDRVPPAWLRQSGRAGLIVAPLGHGLVRVEPEGPDRASGRFLGAAYFMPMRRPGPQPPAPSAADASGSAGRPSRLPAVAVGDVDFRFVVSVLEPDLDWRVDAAVAPRSVSVRAADGSSARRFPDGTVTEAGPRRLWSALEEYHADFEEAGRPGPERYGLTIEGEQQWLWLDSPDGPRRSLPGG